MSDLFDHQLEARIVGVAFTVADAATFYIVERKVEADHFTHHAYRALWRVLQHAANTSSGVEALDDLVVGAILDQHPEMVEPGVDVDRALAALEDATTDPDGEPTGEHADLLIDLAERRTIVATLQAALQDVQRRDLAPSQVIASTSNRLLSASATGGIETYSAREEILTAIERYDKPPLAYGYTTGFPGLDRYVVLEPGTTTVIAARPSMGKSLFVKQVIAHVVRHHEARAMLYSLEMRRKSLTDRLVQVEANVPAAWLKAQKADGAHLDRTERILELANDKRLDRLHWSDRADLTIGEVVAHARMHKAKYPDLGLVVVDYMGLFRSTDPKQLPVNHMADVSVRLRSMAKELEVAVIALAQLNRNSEKERRPPRASDLKDSGSIEQDADNVLLLHEDSGQEAGVPGLGDHRQTAANMVIVAKNREGARGAGTDVRLFFDSDIPKFVDATGVAPVAPMPVRPAGDGFYPDVPLPGRAA